MRGPNQLGRIVFYHEGAAQSYRMRERPTTPLKVAGVVEYQPWNLAYVVQDLYPEAPRFVIREEQVVADGYLASWPPPDGDRKQVAEGLASRMEVLGKECALLAEKLRRNAA